MDDLEIILTAARARESATGPDDGRDVDGDGEITFLDARQAVCTRPNCATEEPPPAEPDAPASPDSSGDAGLDVPPDSGPASDPGTDTSGDGSESQDNGDTGGAPPFGVLCAPAAGPMLWLTLAGLLGLRIRHRRGTQATCVKRNR